LNFEAFLVSLPIMGYGMLGIFVVTFVIMGVIKLLSFIGVEKEQ